MKIDKYEEIGEVDEFDCEEDMEEDLDGTPEYVKIDGTLYKRKEKWWKMERIIGKKFKSIKSSEYGNMVIEFTDGTKAYFNVSTYEDGTISSVWLDKVI